jgi:hypothetical protein
VIVACDVDVTLGVLDFVSYMDSRQSSESASTRSIPHQAFRHCIGHCPDRDVIGNRRSIKYKKCNASTHISPPGSSHRQFQTCG